MPSPETDTDDPAALIAARPAPRPRRRGLWAVLALALAVPVLVTLAGSLSSPPHVKGPPVGHLIYLDADQPSEHTTNLRGLRILGADGAGRQLLHETEAQDLDTGKREWITQPQASPDGRWLAYERQDITILEERREIINQLWVVSLKDPDPKPRMLLDLTKAGLKQFVGLAWSDDSEAVVFLNDGTQCRVSVANGQVTRSPLPRCPPLKPLRGISATRFPSISSSRKLVYIAITTNEAAPSTIVRPPDPSGTAVGIATNAYALAPDGFHIAFGNFNWLMQADTNIHDDALGITQARWGWSAFGGRRITSLKWSPDGRYIAYTVSKPPLEDELFYLDTATKKCYQLPVRTGQGGWDWAP